MSIEDDVADFVDWFVSEDAFGIDGHDPGFFCKKVWELSVSDAEAATDFILGILSRMVSLYTIHTEKSVPFQDKRDLSRKIVSEILASDVA